LVLTGLGLALAACPMSGGAVRPPAVFAGVAGPLIIAHRGGSLEAPENTLAAVAHAIGCGADWQEVDVRLTRDDEVVVIHDDTVDRTTGGKGRVEDLTAAVLRRLPAGSPRLPAEAQAALAALTAAGTQSGAATAAAPFAGFGKKFRDERVPGLAEVLQLPGGRLVIELEPSPRPVVLVERVIAAVHAVDAAQRVALASFDAGLLDLAYQREPAIPLIGLAGRESELADWLDRPIQVLAVSYDLIDAALRLAPPALAVWAWTAYNAEMAEAAVERGAHGVITDVPEAVVAALRTAPPIRLQPSP
jgi:glycerophosphoryl diester phosphodiesterase